MGQNVSFKEPCKTLCIQSAVADAKAVGHGDDGDEGRDGLLDSASNGCVSKKGVQNGPLVNGNMD